MKPKKSVAISIFDFFYIIKTLNHTYIDKNAITTVNNVPQTHTRQASEMSIVNAVKVINKCHLQVLIEESIPHRPRQ